MKFSFLCLTLGSLVFGASAFAQQDNTEWIKKVPQHLGYGTYLGKSNLVRRCSLTLAPSDKGGVIAVIKRTSLFDVLGANDKTLASVHVLPTDDFNTSPVGLPFESENKLAFGYVAGGFVIASEKDSVTVTVVEIRDEKSVIAACKIQK